MKKKTISQLKKKAWEVFSKHIRQLDIDFQGYGVCVTCGVRKLWQELQAGHFIQGRHNMVLYDSRNVHSQCMRCNVFLHGNLIKYYEFMLQTYGQEVIDDLKKLDRQNKKFTREELEEIIKEYA